MRPAIFCSVRVGIWSKVDFKTHFSKGMVFFVSFTNSLPRPEREKVGGGGGTKKIRCPVIFSLCINKEKESVKCVCLNLHSSPGVKCRHVLHERPISAIRTSR